MAIYRGQARKLDRNPVDKSDVIESVRKMEKLGFVDKLENLTSSQKEAIKNGRTQYFIPWRAVWNTNSSSTPCRFDASQVTTSGYSLNSRLAKGRNNMNKLVEILIRWSSHRFGFHVDIRKMQNTVNLAGKDWCQQLNLWHDNLSVADGPYVKVIKTLIYGVKSSGSQAEIGLRTTAFTGHVVKLALDDLHKEQIKLTDSQIALHWISNKRNPLKQWVRNEFVEINRLADRTSWKCVLADLGM